MRSGLLRLLIKVSGKKLILPFYHAVSDNVPDHLKHLYKVRSEKEFIRDLDFLLKHYQPVDLHCYINRLQTSQKIKVNEFILSFDDGLREVYETIRPVLISKGIPATVFLNPGFLDNKDIFYRYRSSILLEKYYKNIFSKTVHKKLSQILNIKSDSPKSVRYAILSLGYGDLRKYKDIAALFEVDFDYYLEEIKPYLTTAQVKKMIDQGFTFGAHSLDHPCYWQIPVEEQLSQTLESVKIVKEKFYTTYGLFSFPFTDHGVTRAFFEKLYSNTDPQVHISVGTAGLKTDTYQQHLQRIAVEKHNWSLASKLIFEYFYYLLKAPVGKNKIKRR